MFQPTQRAVIGWSRLRRALSGGGRETSVQLPRQARMPTALRVSGDRRRQHDPGRGSLAERAGRRPSILLVEDDSSFSRRFLVAVEADCDVQTVDTVEDAMKALAAQRCLPLVVCTHAAWLDLLRRVCTLDRDCRPRVMIMNTTDDPREVIEAVQLGALQYIDGRRPPEELASKVRHVLQARFWFREG